MRVSPTVTDKVEAAGHLVSGYHGDTSPLRIPPSISRSEEGCSRTGLEIALYDNLRPIDMACGKEVKVVHMPF